MEFNCQLIILEQSELFVGCILEVSLIYYIGLSKFQNDGPLQYSDSQNWSALYEQPIDRFHVTSLLPCWRTISKDSSLAFIVSSS